MVYQEQVMQIAQVLSGYSLGGADLLRRAMGKKIQSEMDAQRASFVEGAAKNNVEQARAVDDLRPGGEVRGLRLQQVPRRAPTRWSPTRRPISRPTIRSSSSPRR